MIYDYEANVLRYINYFDSSIKAAIYADDIYLFGALEKVTEYPAFFYHRDETEWKFNKVFSVREDAQTAVVSFAPFLQSYTGSVVLETQAQAQQWASNLRFYMNQYPYLSVAWPTAKDDLRVGLRLLSIKIEDSRNAADRKGSARIVEFKWQSQIFMVQNSSTTLTEKVNIYLRNDGLHVIDSKAILLKIIK